MKGCAGAGKPRASTAAASICACARRPAIDGLEPPARRLAGERFQRGALQISLTVEPPESARGLRSMPRRWPARSRIAREVAAETGLAPARVDGLLALKGVIVADERRCRTTRWRARMRDAAILESLATAFDKLAKDAAAKAPSWRALLTRRSTRSSG